MTPPFQCYAAWAVCFSVPLAAAASFAAYAVAVRAFEAPRRGGLAAGAVALVAASGMIYQPAMLFYVVPLAIDWFRFGAPAPRRWARLFWAGALLGAGIAVAFIAYKIGLAFFADKVDPARAHITADMGGKAEFFVTGPLVDALNLWRLWSTATTAVVVGAGLVVGLFFVQTGGPARRLATLGVAAGLLPVAYLANLAAGETWGPYRTQIALTTLVAVYALLALQGFLRLRAPRALVALIAAAAVAAGLVAVDQVYVYYVDPQMVEMRLMRSQLRDLDLHKVKKIWLLGASWEAVVDSIRYDEFGVPSSSRPWSAVPMTWLVLQDFTDARPRIRIEEAGQPFDAGPTEAILDMRSLDRYR